MFGRNNYCAICGMKVGKESDYERFGKHFCSQNHADEYVQSMQNSRQSEVAKNTENNSDDGCCG